jgi:soluble cytochrome b562
MNEEALKYSYSLFSQDGYNGSIEDYKNLISTNKDALNYSYNLFSSDGYDGSQDDFFNLISSPDPINIEDKDEEVILEPEIAKVPEEIIERNKRWDKGEFLMEEKEAFEEYIKPENKEKRKKLEANEIFSNLETSLKNIPQGKITEETAKNYFKLDQRPVSIVTDPNVEPDFYENLTFKEYREKGLKEGFLTEEEAKFYIGSGSKRVGKKYQPIDQYLSPEKLEEYNNYQQTGVLEALNANDEAEIKAAKNQSLDNLYKKETQLFLRNVSEEVKDLMGPFGTDKKYKNVEDAVKSLDLGREILIENNNKLKEDYNSYIEQSKPYQEGINNIIEKINNIEKNIPSGNVEDGTDTQIKEYQILLAEAEKLQDEYEQKGLNTVYDNLAKQQKLNELNLDKFNNETRDVQTKAIIEKQLGLDYSLSARTGMALEEFFVGGLLNFGSLTSQLLLKGGKVLANPANGAIIDNITESIVQTTRDYNSKLAEKRETTIPDNITLDDIESENVNFFDWFGEALANNSPSIITTFVPGGAALKSGIMIKTATKAGEKAARNAAAKLVTAGTRTAQGIFFIGESGGRYGDLELQQGRALENLPKLKKQIEEELDPAKKMQMQEDYEDLERISDYSFAQKAFTSYAYGTAATLAETLGSLRIINGASKLASKMGKQQFKAGAYASPLNFAANTTGKAISGISKNAGKAIAIEEAEETLTQVAHNLIDILALKENKSIIEGIDKEFLANTAVTSFAIMAPKTMGNTRNMLKNEFTTREEILNNQDDVIELIQLQEQFKALESGPEKTALRKRRRELLNKLAIADGMTLTKLNSMTNEEVVESADLARQMRQLKNQMFELGRTGELSEGGRKARKQIEDQYNSVNKRREDLLNKRLKEDRSKIKDLREELGENFVNLNAEYYFGLYDFYKNVAMTLMPKNGKFIVVDTKNKNWRNDLTDLSKEELAEVENVINTGSNAAAVNNNIIINENVVNLNIATSGVFTEGAYAAAAPIEELFHIQNKAKNIVDKDGVLSEEATKAVDQAIEVIKNKFELGKISEQDYNDLITRFNLYKTGGKGKVVLKSGKRGKATADAEEIMAQMNNAVAIGALKLEDIETIPSIKDFINGISKDIFGDSSWMFDLKTANDVFNFIKNYQSNIQEGVKLALPEDEDEIFKLSKAASDNVQKIYEEQGVAGALDIIEEFKPIVSKLVQKRSEAPNFDRELLTSEIEIGLISKEPSPETGEYKQRSILGLIREYGPYVEKQKAAGKAVAPLAGFINKQLPKRMIEASQKILGESFTEDVSERVDIAAPEVEVEIKTKEEKVPRSLRKKLNIEKGSDLYNKVKDAVVKTFGTKLPEVTDPKFKKALSDSYKRELKKEINGLMGTRSDFKMFVTNNAETLYKSIPQETINKRFQAFSEPVLDKEGKQVREKTAVGKGIFKKKPFNKEEFINYFLGEDVGASTKGTRKTALSETIADEMALDATMEVIEDPKVFEKFKEIQEIEGKEVPKDIKPKISEKVKRPEGFKFSASSINNASREFLRKKGVKEIKFNFENEEFTYDVNKGPLKNTDNTAVKYYQYITQEILPKYLPISNLVNSNNYASRSDKFGRGHFMTGKQRTSIVNKGLKNERKFTDKERKIVKETTSQKAFTTTKKGKKQLVNFGSKEYLQKTTNNYDGLEYILFQLQEMVKDYPGTSNYVAALFNSASGNSGHFIRQSAMPRGVDQGFIDAGFKGEKEHIWQQNQAAETMFDDILNSTVKKNFSFIKNNYFMLGISNTNNNKLKDLSGKYGEKYNYGNLPPNVFIDSLVEALKNNDFSKAMSIWIRYFNSNVNRNNGGMNPNSLTFDGETVAELFNVSVEAKYRNNPDVIAFQNSLIEDQIVNGLDPKAAKELLKEYLKLIPQKTKANKFSKSTLSNSKVLDVEGNLSTQDLLNKAATIDEALKIARDPNAPVKKIRVFDFDDTLATTKSDVLFTAPDGTEGKLNAEEFAKQGAQLLEEGYVFDFSEFNKVTKGKPGPLLDIAKKIQAARGTEDVFVLTARAPEAQIAIKEFLDSVGLKIPLENITGLGNSTGEAKANWMVEKAAEGYNDFYFADDAYQNVKAVKDAMSVLDVKSKVQQAKIKFSKSVNEDFNKIIEQTTGIASEKVYSEAKAKVRGANKGNKKFFIPYSAEDFMGLIYPLLSKGKLGDSQMAWFKQNLLDPYARAQENISADRLQLMEDFKALKKALEVPKDLRKKTDSGFTKAVRVYLFNKAGFDVPGISKTDLNELLDLVNSDGVLKAFGDQIFNITKGDGYAKPGESWLVGTITTDLIDVLNTVKRAKYLEQSGYTANAELIFSKENLNKLEAAYGTKYREAMENILGRMKSGKNRIFSGNRLSNRVLDYINNSTGAIMFFNTRSAVLQTISAVNFLNWSFNNPIKAGAAFANQKQYWKDFVELINSDYLMDRRNGLKLNINESEIADAAATSKNKAKAAINYILQKGFLPTQFADSFAIASGGATFYRNRINDLVENQGMSEADAKNQAMLEWRETAEVSQQSSDPSKISAQQASDLGRVILAFANTPMQYARIQKRAVQDLINGRGDAKTHISKIIYYAVVQNLIFNALQSALFGLGFGDDEDDEKKEKMYLRTANGMLDSQLRGLGLAGATVAVIKNFLTDIYERSGRSRPEYVDSIYKLLQISPPISSKISKIRGAAYQFDSKKRREEIFKKGFNIDNPAYEAFAKVISATANIPLDRVYSKIDNISGAMSEDAETWQTIAMLAGWPKWNIMPNSKKSSSFSRGNVKIKRRKLKRKTLRR